MTFIDLDPLPRGRFIFSFCLPKEETKGKRHHCVGPCGIPDKNGYLRGNRKKNSLRFRHFRFSKSWDNHLFTGQPQKGDFRVYYPNSAMTITSFALHFTTAEGIARAGGISMKVVWKRCEFSHHCPTRSRSTGNPQGEYWAGFFWVFIFLVYVKKIKLAAFSFKILKQIFLPLIPILVRF